MSLKVDSKGLGECQREFSNVRIVKRQFFGENNGEQRGKHCN